MTILDTKRAEDLIREDLEFIAKELEAVNHNLGQLQQRKEQLEGAIARWEGVISEGGPDGQQDN